MPPRAKRPRSPSPTALLDVAATASSSSAPALESPHKSKKLKLLASHAAASPFPDHARPTPAEAAEVHAVLARAHPAHARARQAPLDTNNSAQTCGKVPNVLESLIGTVLSQNTSNANSSGAKRSLDAAFGRNDFGAIARAPRAAVVEALKHGGLANKKAAVIQALLEEVKERHGDYSLQHLAGMSDDEVMQELVSYNGVGPKTASCVLLFCLGRDSFAVDTHVFRLSKLLGWVPPRADRVSAQAHLDLRIPDALKYGLHVLMVTHGRACGGCKGKGKGGCVLKEWLRDRKGVKAEEVEEKAEEVYEEVKKEEGEVKREEGQEIEEDARSMEVGKPVKQEGDMRRSARVKREDGAS